MRQRKGTTHPFLRAIRLGVDMPPFKSKAQARFMYAKHPKLAKEFSEHTKSIKKLPEHVKPKAKTKKGTSHGKKGS